MKIQKGIQLLRDFSLTCATGRQEKVYHSIYMAELRRLSQYCEYGNSLDSMFRDCLVCGINHDRRQQRLLSEGANLSLQKTMDISLSLESAKKQAAVIQNKFKQPNEAVSKIEQKTSSRHQSAKCFRYKNLQNPKSCPFIDKECFFAKIRDTHPKFAEKKPSHHYPSSILPM